MRWFVDKKAAGLSLHNFLKERLESYSGRKIKKAIDRHLCFINGVVEHFSNITLKKGDKIVFHIEGLDAVLGRYVFENERVLYDDGEVLVYDKPAGITSEDLEKLSKSLFLAHRLDRDTSGVLVFAKNKKKKEELHKLFRLREVRKVYLAIADGIPKKRSGEICNFLGKIEEGKWGAVRRGKSAETSWELVKSAKRISLLRCLPKTGRTHQIRVHLSGMGHPILGDHCYGERFRYQGFIKRQLLHAYEISFADITVQAPLPSDFLEFNFLFGYKENL
jgi:RluA family pseudouridine synthase